MDFFERVFTRVRFPDKNPRSSLHLRPRPSQPRHYPSGYLKNMIVSSLFQSSLSFVWLRTGLLVSVTRIKTRAKLPSLDTTDTEMKSDAWSAEIASEFIFMCVHLQLTGGTRRNPHRVIVNGWDVKPRPTFNLRIWSSTKLAIGWFSQKIWGSRNCLKNWI